jgi:hypothetical protein
MAVEEDSYAGKREAKRANVLSDERCTAIGAGIDHDRSLLAGDQNRRNAAGADVIGIGENLRWLSGIVPAVAVLAGSREVGAKAFDRSDLTLDLRRRLLQRNGDELDRGQSEATELNSRR